MIVKRIPLFESAQDIYRKLSEEGKRSIFLMVAEYRATYRKTFTRRYFILRTNFDRSTIEDVFYELESRGFGSVVQDGMIVGFVLDLNSVADLVKDDIL